MENKMKGLLKGSHKGLMTGALFMLAIALSLGIAYVAIVSAAHSTTTTVAPAGPLDTSQAIQMNFTVTRTGTEANISIFDINFTAAGWTLPASNNSVTCSSGFNSSLPGGGIIRCFNFSVVAFGGSTFNITVSNTAAPAYPVRSNFTINTTEVNATSGVLANITNSSTVGITISQLSGSVTVNDTKATISTSKNYRFAITNNGTDAINRIIINWTNAGFADTEVANVTCPTLGAGWGSATIDAGGNTLTCTSPDSGSDLTDLQSTNLSISNFLAPSAAGVRTFDFDFRGALGGNITLQADRPTITVVGTMALTSVDRASGATTVAVGAANKVLGQINLSSAGENLSSIRLRVNTIATNLANDVSKIMIFNDTNCDGAVSSEALLVSDSVNQSMVMTLPATGVNTGKVPIGSAQCYIIAYNISATATGGNTIKISVGGANATATGDNSSSEINSTGTDFASSTVTIFGALNVTGTNRVASTKVVGSTNVLVITYNFTATGEQMNVTNIQVTRTGTSQDADVAAVALYNETGINDGVLNGTETLLGWKTASPNGVYNFTSLGFVLQNGPVNYTTVLLVVNLSASATGGRTFGFQITPDNISTTSAVSGQSITETVTGGVSTASTIFGNSTITGINQNTATTVIGSTNVTVIIYNITAGAEQMNLTWLNITRLGTSTATPNPNITAVGLYNNSVGTSLATSSLIRWNASEPTNGVYVFNISSDGDDASILNISAGGYQHLIVVFNVSGSAEATGGTTFGANIAAANLSMRGGSSGVIITPTITSSNSSLSTIFGNLSVTSASLSGTTVDQGQEAGMIRMAFLARGEAININELNFTMSNTNNNDVTAVKLYNDTDASNTFNPADTLVATATLSGNVARFGSGSTNGIFNVTRDATRTLIVTFTINSSATANNVVNGSVAAAANITATGGSSAIGMTTIGSFALTSAGSRVIALSATAGLNATTQQISTINAYNFTVVNPASSDSINEIRINYTASGFADPVVANVTCPTIGPGTWDGSVDSSGDVVKCTKNATASVLSAGKNASIIITGLLSPATGGTKIFYVTVNGSAGGNFTIFSSAPNVTVSGTSAITGIDKNTVNRTIGFGNATIIVYNVTATGEAANLSELNITVLGTATNADIVAVALYNSSSGVTVEGATLISGNGTRSGINVNFTKTIQAPIISVAAGGYHHLILVFNISGSATGGRTFGANIAAANLTVRGGTSNIAITPTLTTVASATPKIFGNSTITGINRLGTTVNVSQTNVTVMVYNITATGEQINLTWFNITRLGTSTATPNPNITAVGLFNNSVTTDIVGSTLIRWNASEPTNGVYVFNISSDGDDSSILNISAGGYQHLIVVFNISGAAGVTFGTTVGANIATANMSMRGGSSNVIITPTLSSSNSSLATIVGTSTVTGINQNTVNRNLSTANVTVIIYNITATGEAMNLTNFNVTRLGTIQNGDITAVGIFNSTVSTAIASATLVAWNTSAPVNGVYNFSAAPLVNVASGNNSHILVVFNVSGSATGGRTFGADIASSNATFIGATSGQNMGPTYASTNSSLATIFGTSSITGLSQVSLTTNISSTNVNVVVYNITATGEAMNLTEFNVTMLGTASASDVISISLYNSSTGTVVSGATLISGNGTRSGINVRFSGSPLISVAAGGYHHLILAVNISSGATTGNTFGINIATANLTLRGGTSNIEAVPAVSATNSSTSTIMGTSSITGINQNTANKNVSSTNVAVVVYNFTATGEQMNITWLNITRLGTVQNTDIAAVGVYNNSVTTSITGSTLVGWNTSAPVNGVYVFNVSADGGAGIVSVASGGNQHIMVVLNISGSATGGRTFGADTAAANLSIVSATTGQAIRPTITSTNSSLATIFGTSALTGINQLSTPKVAGTSNITIVVYNITATGEAVNVTELNITRLGTANNNDVSAVGVFNNSVAGQGLAAATLIAWNTSSPSSLAYRFSGSPLISIGAGGNQHIIVVFNLTSTAQGGNTFGADTATANLTLRGGTSNIEITPAVSGTNSSALAVSTLNVTGINKLGTITDIGATNVVVIVYNMTTAGEAMNLTAINVTRGGSAVDSDVVAVGIFNSSSSTAIADATLLRWNTSIPSGGVYNFTGANLMNISSGGNQHLLVVFNISGSATGGRTFGVSLGSSNFSVTSATSGAAVSAQTFASATSNTSTIAGTLTITGTSRAPSNATVGTKGIVAVTLNFSATSEQMNISEIIITRNGSSISDNEIANVILYNHTVDDGLVNGNETFIANRSASSSGVYNFSGLSFRVASGGSQIVFVVVNLTDSAFSGRTFGFGLNGSADVATTGGTTGQSITETITTGISVTSTINGNATITGTSRSGAYTAQGTSNLTIISYSFTAFGESMNVTNFNLTKAGTAANTDIVAVGLFNATNDDGFLNATETLVAWNLSAPASSSVYAFTGSTLFTVTNGTTQVLVVVINVSSTAVDGRTFGFTTVAANMTITGLSSGVAISPSVTTLNSSTTAFTTDNGAPTITATGPEQTVSTSTPAMAINTSEAATCRFDNSSKLYSGMTYTMTGSGTTHNFTLWSLADGTYTFYVRCADTFGNAMTSSESITFTVSTAAPSISSVTNSTVTAYSAIINWTTDIAASSIVEYGKNTSTLVSTAEYDTTTRVTTHSITLNDLEKGTLYYYRVKSKGANGKDNTSAISNFTTSDNITQWLGTGWNQLSLPSQTIMELRGYNSSNTGSFNFTSILVSLGTNWNYMYYNINGSSSGWVLATRTDPGGSTLKYLNNTNDKPYWINVTSGSRFIL